MDKRVKKVVYYFVGIVWGVLLSFVLHAWIEMYYINSLLSQNIIPEPSSTLSLILIGIIFGGSVLKRRRTCRMATQRR